LIRSYDRGFFIIAELEYQRANLCTMTASYTGVIVYNRPSAHGIPFTLIVYFTLFAKYII